MMDVQPVDEHEEATKEVDDRALWALVKQLQKLLPLMERIADRLDEQSKQTVLTWSGVVGAENSVQVPSSVDEPRFRYVQGSGMIYLPLGEDKSE